LNREPAEAARAKKARLLLALAASAGLGGCVAVPDVAARSRIPVDSPLNAEVARVKANPGPFPSFANIPSVPADLRPSGSWTQTQTTLEASAGALAAIPVPPADGQSDAWAKTTRAAAGLDAITPPPADNTARIEAYAAQLRERATPPPKPR
jgi:hypothetical protein